MDEPTNDLDAETLELLEELLAEYPGTLLLVSHDREFIDNVITSCLVMEGNGQVGEYVGGYSDWLRQKSRQVDEQSRQAEPVSKPGSSTAQGKATNKPAKLSYKLARELEQLPGKMEKIEQRLAEIGMELNDPALYRQSAEEISRRTSEAQALQLELDGLYARWEELEGSDGPA